MGFVATASVPDKGEVDHFRPKSRFPDSVYEWSNWIFACHDVQPGESATSGLIEWLRRSMHCMSAVSLGRKPTFTFDTKTGEIVPLKGLDSDSWDKAQGMIDDLQASMGWHHLE